MDERQTVRFAKGIASTRFSYDEGRVVEVGTKYGQNEVPASVVVPWRDAGILAPADARTSEPVACASPPATNSTTTTPAVQRRNKRPT